MGLGTVCSKQKEKGKSPCYFTVTSFFLCSISVFGHAVLPLLGKCPACSWQKRSLARLNNHSHIHDHMHIYWMKSNYWAKKKSSIAQSFFVLFGLITKRLTSGLHFLFGTDWQSQMGQTTIVYRTVPLLFEQLNSIWRPLAPLYLCAILLRCCLGTGFNLFENQVHANSDAMLQNKFKWCKPI